MTTHIAPGAQGDSGASDPEAFLSGGGEMAALIRGFGWSGTPLGPLEHWPAGLRAIIGMILCSPLPIVTLWGADGVMIYNDAYSGFAGARHPQLLGSAVREGWPEVAAFNDNVMRVVLAGGTLSYKDQELTLHRNGRPEQVWMNLDYSPVPDEAGRPAGVIAIVVETTDLVLGERRLRESETHLAAVVDQTAAGVVETDLTGRFIAANDRYCQLVGRSRAELFELRMQDITHPDDLPANLPLFEAMVERGEPFAIVKRYVRPDGEIVWVDNNVSLIRTETGAASGFAISLDVTERVRAEHALRESEQRFRNMADHAPVMMWVTEPDGRCTYLNRRWYEFTGQTQAEAEGFGWLDAAHPDDREIADRAFREANAARAPFRVEYRLRRVDGSYRWAIDAATPRFDGTGAFLGYVGSVIDIDDRREAEAAIQASEARLRLTTEAAGIGTWDFDPATGELRWDALCKTLFGLPADAEVDYPLFLSLLHPDDRGPTDAAVRAVIGPGGTGDYDVEYRLIRGDDAEERWIAASGRAIYPRPDEPAARFLGIVIDITERKRAAAALAHSEAALRLETRRLETLNQTGAALAAELDLDKIVQRVTDAAVELTGAQFGAFFYNVLDRPGESYMLYALSGVGRGAFDKFPMPRNTAIFAPTFTGKSVVRSGDIMQDSRYGKSGPHHGMPEGHLPVRSYLAVPVVSRSGEVIGGLFFGHAEPDRFTAQHEQLIIGIAGQAAVAVDNARLFDSAQREIGERRRIAEELRALNETLESRVADEIARRSEAEERLRQAQKMETVGQLTGGVAHDFNNLLQVVTGNLEMVLRNLPLDSPRLKRAADNAMKGAERAATLTQRLLAFSRRQPLDPKPADLNQLVAGMSELLHRTLDETVAVETLLAPELWRVEVDTNQLENALLNLAVNARDAMPDGGKLVIRTANAEVVAAGGAAAGDEDEPAPGQYVLISVSDTGIGMDPATVRRAFEPFFTTKEVGRGTGLGLSMVYGFVRQSGGHLRLESAPGAGTDVKIYLPRFHGAMADRLLTAEQQVPEGETGETVLVCEDDPDVRGYSTDVLRELGYLVLEAADGQAALRLLAQEERRVDLLFTDVVLPGGMTGAEVAEAARRLSPGIRVLFTTGYARDAIVHDGRLDAGVELIAKPFGYAELAARVRDILDAPPPV